MSSTNTPCQHTLSTHALSSTNTPCQHTLSTHPINTPCHQPTHPVNTPSYQYALFIHSNNTSYPHALSTLLPHPINPHCPPQAARSIVTEVSQHPERAETLSDSLQERISARNVDAKKARVLLTTLIMEQNAAYMNQIDKVCSSSYQHTPIIQILAHPVNTPYQHILSSRLINTSR